MKSGASNTEQVRSNHHEDAIRVNVKRVRERVVQPSLHRTATPILLSACHCVGQRATPILLSHVGQRAPCMSLTLMTTLRNNFPGRSLVLVQYDESL